MLAKQFFPIQVRGFKPKVRHLLLIFHVLLNRSHLITAVLFFSAAEVKPLEERIRSTVTVLPKHVLGVSWGLRVSAVIRPLS